MKIFDSIITILIVLFAHNILLSQSINGEAIYVQKTQIDLSDWNSKEVSDYMKKMIEEQMKKLSEKTFILTFNNTESIYKEEEKLETGATGRGFGMMMGSFTAGDQYKNLETNQLLEEREFFGKEFLVNDTLAKLDWKVGKESKQIGQYLAIKATAVKQLDSTDISAWRPRRRDNDEEKKEGEVAKDSSKASDDPMDDIEMRKELLITAWFTPQIPVKNGPGEYGGLPGLILELNADRTTILCSKIVLNTKDGETIEKPTKGKEVTREEYQTIVMEKTKEMRENFRNRGGRRGGGRRF